MISDATHSSSPRGAVAEAPRPRAGHEAARVLRHAVRHDGHGDVGAGELVRGAAVRAHGDAAGQRLGELPRVAADGQRRLLRRVHERRLEHRAAGEPERRHEDAAEHRARRDHAGRRGHDGGEPRGAEGRAHERRAAEARRRHREEQRARVAPIYKGPGVRGPRPRRGPLLGQPPLGVPQPRRGRLHVVARRGDLAVVEDVPRRYGASVVAAPGRALALLLPRPAAAVFAASRLRPISFGTGLSELFAHLCCGCPKGPDRRTAG